MEPVRSDDDSRTQHDAGELVLDSPKMRSKRMSAFLKRQEKSAGIALDIENLPFERFFSYSDLSVGQVKFMAQAFTETLRASGFSEWDVQEIDSYLVGLLTHSPSDIEDPVLHVLRSGITDQPEGDGSNSPDSLKRLIDFEAECRRPYSFRASSFASSGQKHALSEWCKELAKSKIWQPLVMTNKDADLPAGFQLLYKPLKNAFPSQAPIASPAELTLYAFSALKLRNNAQHLLDLHFEFEQSASTRISSPILFKLGRECLWAVSESKPALAFQIKKAAQLIDPKVAAQDLQVLESLGLGNVRPSVDGESFEILVNAKEQRTGASRWVSSFRSQLEQLGLLDRYRIIERSMISEMENSDILTDSIAKHPDLQDIRAARLTLERQEKQLPTEAVLTYRNQEVLRARAHQLWSIFIDESAIPLHLYHESDYEPSLSDLGIPDPVALGKSSAKKVEKASEALRIQRPVERITDESFSADNQKRPDFEMHAKAASDSLNLIEVFGIRGVQVGSSLSGRQAQRLASHLYFSFVDLQRVTGLPINRMGLGIGVTDEEMKLLRSGDGVFLPAGEGMPGQALKITLQARGKGGVNAPRAHYESGKHLINIAGSGGAGALAHEYGHALDFYFSNLFRPLEIDSRKEALFFKKLNGESHWHAGLADQAFFYAMRFLMDNSSRSLGGTGYLEQLGLSVQSQLDNNTRVEFRGHESKALCAALGQWMQSTLVSRRSPEERFRKAQDRMLTDVADMILYFGTEIHPSDESQTKLWQSLSLGDSEKANQIDQAVGHAQQRLMDIGFRPKGFSSTEKQVLTDLMSNELSEVAQIFGNRLAEKGIKRILDVLELLKSLETNQSALEQIVELKGYKSDLDWCVKAFNAMDRYREGLESFLDQMADPRQHDAQTRSHLLKAAPLPRFRINQDADAWEHQAAVRRAKRTISRAFPLTTSSSSVQSSLADFITKKIPPLHSEQAGFKGRIPHHRAFLMLNHNHQVMDSWLQEKGVDLNECDRYDAFRSLLSDHLKAWAEQRGGVFSLLRHRINYADKMVWEYREKGLPVLFDYLDELRVDMLDLLVMTNKDQSRTDLQSKLFDAQVRWELGGLNLDEVLEQSIEQMVAAEKASILGQVSDSLEPGTTVDMLISALESLYPANVPELNINTGDPGYLKMIWKRCGLKADAFEAQCKQSIDNDLGGVLYRAAQCIQAERFFNESSLQATSQVGPCSMTEVKRWAQRVDHHALAMRYMQQEEVTNLANSLMPGEQEIRHQTLKNPWLSDSLAQESKGLDDCEKDQFFQLRLDQLASESSYLLNEEVGRLKDDPTAPSGLSYLIRTFHQDLLPKLMEASAFEHVKQRLPDAVDWVRVREWAGRADNEEFILSRYAQDLFSKVGVCATQAGEVKWEPRLIKNTYPIHGSELFARQFEALVEDKLQQEGLSNRFLVGGTDQPVMYSAGAERLNMNRAVERAVQTMVHIEPRLQHAFDLQSANKNQPYRYTSQQLST